MSTVREPWTTRSLPLRGQRGRHVTAFQQWMKSSVLFSVTDLDSGDLKPFLSIQDAKNYLAHQNNARLDEILSELFPDVLPIDASTILDEFAAVFCILIELNSGSTISEFVNLNWNDQRLPCEPSDAVFTDFGEAFHRRFCDVQMKFCVPSFKPKMHRKYDKSRLLPISKARKLSDQGGDATMYEIEVHGEYNKLLGFKDTDSPQTNIFALKRYNIDTVRSYDSELEAFRRLHRYPDPHLIGFHGDYVQGSTFNILLEWADQGSLEAYFEKTTPPSADIDIIKFWTSILFGIIKALHSIHQSRSGTADTGAMNGWHQDVKPKNVLVVSEGAASPYEFQFKLSDFGHAHFHASVDDGGSSTAEDASGTQTYGAPECFRSNSFWDNSSLRVKRCADIWSVGCVLSEAAVWVGKDYTSILNYRNERGMATESLSKRLGDCFHDGKRVLPTVQKWHSSLREALRGCDRITSTVLDMIESCMLTNPADRLYPEQLLGRVKGMLEEVQNSPTAFSPHGGFSERFTSSSRPGNATSVNQQRRTGTLHGGQNAPQPSFRNTLQHDGLGRKTSHIRFSVSANERLEEPDTTPMHGEGGYSDFMHAQAGPSNPNHWIGRSASQPNRSAHRPLNPRSPFSDPDNAGGNAQYDSEQQDLFEMHPRPRSAFGITREASSGPMRDSQGIANQQSRTLTPTLYPKNPNMAPRQYAEECSEADEEDDIYRDNYSTAGEVGRRQSKRSIQLDHFAQTGRATPSQYRPGMNESGMAHVLFSNTPAPDTGQVPTRFSQATGKQVANSRTRATVSKLPFVPIVTAMKWREDKKESDKFYNILFRKPSEVPLLGSYLFDRVGKRDHVFIIDDAISMRDHWAEVCEVFSILAYMVKKSDEDGVEVYFTMDGESQRNKNVTVLTKTVKKRKERLELSSNINSCLDKILSDYNGKLRREIELRRAYASSAPRQVRKPLTVYVLTDGRWSDSTDPTRAIKNLVESLAELKCPSSQVGIQFISFGNDPDALDRFDHYDSGLGFEFDIVDHEPSNGNVWKMILGAIDSEFDHSNEATTM